jgi:hypothetical protein
MKYNPCSVLLLLHIFAQVFLMALPDTCNFAVPLNYALVAVPLFEVKFNVYHP